MQRTFSPLFRFSRLIPLPSQKFLSTSLRYISTQSARTSAAVAAQTMEHIGLHPSFHVPTIGELAAQLALGVFR